MQPRAARFALFVVLCVFLTIPALTSAQASTPRLIVQPVDENQLTVLKGNTHPMARAQFDRGAAPPSLPMERMLLVLKRSPEQEDAHEPRSEEHTSELQSLAYLVCRLLLEKKK